MTERGSAEALERLSTEEVESGSLLALTHTQRYRFAASFAAGLRVVDLCCGVGYGSAILADVAASVTGVDIDPSAIAAARERASGATADFHVGDACDFLEGLGGAEVDLIVCFEGIEHVPDARRVVEALGRLVRLGVRFLGSLPNSGGFEEDNPFHTIDFGYEEAAALFGQLGDFTLLDQRPAEGSVIRVTDEAAQECRGVVTIGGFDDSPEWAGHWLAACNLDQRALRQAVMDMRAVAVPNHQRYMRTLEQANEELYRANLRLSRDHLGKHDAAAGITVGRLERAVAEAEASKREALKAVKAVERARDDAMEAARINDELFQEARRTLFERDDQLRALRRRSFRGRLQAFVRRHAVARVLVHGVRRCARLVA